MKTAGFNVLGAPHSVGFTSQACTTAIFAHFSPPNVALAFKMGVGERAGMHKRNGTAYRGADFA